MKQEQGFSTSVPLGGSSRRLGVLTVGLGAVATTFVAGVELIRRHGKHPVGSLSQLGALESATGERVRIADAVSLAPLDGLVFGAWDVLAGNAHERARQVNVLSREDIDSVAEPLSAIQPMPGVFLPEHMPTLEANRVKSAKSKRDLVDALREDIRAFRRSNALDDVVAVYCASTEFEVEPSPSHRSYEAFLQGLEKGDPSITASMMYACACIEERVGFANGAPNSAVAIPALRERARELGVPISGSDFKTGQTMMKTAIAPALQQRALGVNGWFSTNILGNRDGHVLDQPAAFRAKERSKAGVLESILEDRGEGLYADLFHKVRIEYYPPRGDAKEGWDNIDLFGWLGYPMQIKINFLCRDSILAAPIVLDLALFTDVAARAGWGGVQEWLGFYFKAPETEEGTRALHDLFAQRRKLDRSLARLALI